MPRRGRTRKKTRTHITEDEKTQAEGAKSALKSNATDLKTPRSVITRRGDVPNEVCDLITDLRKLMMPYTALNLKDSYITRKLRLVDYAKELGPTMGVTHILSFSQRNYNNRRGNVSAAATVALLKNEEDKDDDDDEDEEEKDNEESTTKIGRGLYLRIGRFPLGPTLGFQIKQFTLCSHIKKLQKRPIDATLPAYQDNSPIVVTNNFGGAEAPPHVKIMRITFQNMFPAINVTNVKLSNCRRVVLFNLITNKNKGAAVDGGAPPVSDGESEKEGDSEYEHDELVEVRHYAIKATPVGVDRKVRRIIQSRLPNLNKLDDISEYILGTSNTVGGASATSYDAGGAASDSEPEDEATHVVLPQKYAGKGNAKSQKSALKLVELGPRLTMKLVKVERELGSGDVMYHAFVQKTPEEAMELKQKAEQKVGLKKRRREEQEANVERKLREKEEKKQRKLMRKEEQNKKIMEELRRGNTAEDSEEEEESDESGSEVEE